MSTCTHKWSILAHAGAETLQRRQKQEDNNVNATHNCKAGSKVFQACKKEETVIVSKGRETITGVAKAVREGGYARGMLCVSSH